MARRNEKNENSGLKKLVIFLAILVIAFPAAAFGYVYFKLNVMHDSSADESILNENNYQAEKGITNILLAGTDGRPGEESSRSDAMMILTVDTVNKSLKLTSLNRDTYVDIPGHGYQKLTHAYAYGGANLLTETIETNFELDIQDYAVVDFYSFMDIVDALGGVEVDVNQNEIKEINKFIEKETYKWSNQDEPIQLIKHSGIQKLNGYQALSYARIRKNDSTQERDRRQRQVIEGLMTAVKNLPISKYPNLLDTILPYVKTNMKPTEIIGVGGKILGIGNLSISQIEFPFANASTPVTLSGAGFVIKYDESSLDTLHDFIFKNIIP